MFNLFNMIFSVVAMVVDGFLGLGFLYLLYVLAVFIPGFAVTIRRMHDLDKSGWWFFINFIPFIGFIWFFILLCTDGTPGPNRFGPSPKHGADQIAQLGDQMDPDPANEPVFNEPAAETMVELDATQVQSDLIPITLNIDNGSLSGSFFSVSSGQRIGRAPDNDIVLSAKTVSSYHAEIFIKDNLFFIRDLDSTNGTKINGERIAESVLELGSSLRIGEIELSIK